MNDLSATDLDELSIPDDDIDDFFDTHNCGDTVDDGFIPAGDDDFIHPDKYSRVCAQRDQYLKSMCIYVSDMETAARHLMWAVTHFRSIMDAFDRAQLLDCHAQLVYPDATFNEDVAQLIELNNARTLVDIADADTGEVLFEKMALGFVFPDNRSEGPPSTNGASFDAVSRYLPNTGNCHVRTVNGFLKIDPSGSG